MWKQHDSRPAFIMWFSPNGSPTSLVCKDVAEIWRASLPAKQYSTGIYHNSGNRKARETNTLAALQASCGWLPGWLSSVLRPRQHNIGHNYGRLFLQLWAARSCDRSNLYNFCQSAHVDAKPCCDRARYYAILITASQFLDKPRDASASVAEF